MTDTSASAANASAATDESAHVSGLFGHDMVYLGFWAVQIVLAAALTPVLTRVLGQAEFGIAAACQALMQLLVALFSFGLQTAVQRAYVGEDGEANARRLVTLAMLLAAAAGLAVYATGRWWCPVIGLGAFPPPVRFAVLWAAMSAITYPALGLVRSRDQLRVFMAASFAQSFFAQALALALVILIQRTAAQYMLGQFLAQVVAAAIVLAVARPKRIRRIDRSMLSDSLRFSTALVPAMVASFIVEASDRLVIQGDLGARELSHYAVARNVGAFAMVLLTFLDFVWLPRLYEIRDAAMRRGVLSSGRDGLGSLVVLFALALCAASPAILALWAPPSYDPNHLLLITALIAAAAIPNADGLIYTQALIVEGRTRAVAAATAVAAFSNLALNLLLVPALGIDGSAGISLGCYALYALIVRRLAGAAGPLTSPRYVLIAGGGAALCIASAAVPAAGIELALRMLAAVLAASGCLLVLARLIGSSGQTAASLTQPRATLRAMLAQLRALRAGT